MTERIIQPYNSKLPVCEHDSAVGCKNFQAQVEDRIFCLSYELSILSLVVTNGQLERWVPGYSYEHTDKEHSLRYHWVNQFLADQDVLDIACGAGRGSYMMITEGKAKNVTGCDIDPNTVRYASIRNKHENLKFVTQNAESFTTNHQFDVIVSFETIEHLSDVKAFLEHTNRSLKKSGRFFVSTPISDMDINEAPDNQHHVREWGFYRFHEVISQYFRVDKVYVQLYNPVKSGWDRAWDRIKGIPRQDDIISAPTPWNHDKIPAGELGKVRRGYQILECTK